MLSREEGKEEVRALVEIYKERRQEYTRGDSTYNETELRNDFLNPFLIALGWDVFNRRGAPQHLRDVVHEDIVEVEEEAEGELLSKKPDYALRAGGERKFFLEAKKPSVRIETHKPSAFQVRRYGWSGGLPISVLTNFDKLVIYDCRPIPKADDDVRIARIKVYEFTEYVDKFEEIHEQLSCESVYSGRFDELFGSIEEYAGQTFDQYFLEQIEKWRSDLANDISGHNARLSEEELNFLVQRLINRILFLRICEDRALEKAKALKEVETYEDLKQVFLRADERYNSGLFDFIEDKLSLAIEVGDDLLVGIFKELYYPDSPYNFAVLESSLLGEVYELFLARTIELNNEGVRVVEKPEIKESGGVVSTPRFIVDSIIQRSLGPFCEGKDPKDLSTLRVADISCGSGSFLVAAYEFLQQYHVEWYLADGPEKHREEIYRVGNNEWRLTLPERRRILLNNIYGVDIDIQAVEVTRFSLLLKALEDTTLGEVDAYLRKHKLKALPKLDGNIQCGNSLVDSNYFDFEDDSEEDIEELATVNPFDWEDAFPEIMGEGGFDLLIGNPPYIRIQNMVKYSPNEVEYYQSDESPYATAKTDNFDKYNLFIERAISLLKPTGWLGYIVPHKFSVIRAGRALRGLIASGAHLAEFVNFGVQQVFGKRVTTYVCILRLSKEGRERFTVERVSDLVKWRYGQAGATTVHQASDISDEPWHFAGDRVIALFDRIRSSNVRNLSEVADIFVGLQTSADKIYIFRPIAEDDSYAVLGSKSGEHKIERGILRSCLYKVHFSDFLPPKPNTYMIFPYKIVEDRAELYSLEEMAELFPNTLRYLSSHREKLSQRNVAHLTDENWYQFGRSQSLTRFNGEPKLIWSTLLHEPRYVYDDRNIVFTGGGNGPYYSLRVKEESPSRFFDERRNETLFYIQAILHHPVIDAMVAGSEFRGGYVSHGKQYVAGLPIRIIDPDSHEEVRLFEAIVRVTRQLNDIALRAATATTPQRRDLFSRRFSALRREVLGLVEHLYGIGEADIEAIREINE